MLTQIKLELEVERTKGLTAKEQLAAAEARIAELNSEAAEGRGARSAGDNGGGGADSANEEHLLQALEEHKQMVTKYEREQAQLQLKLDAATKAATDAAGAANQAHKQRAAAAAAVGGGGSVDAGSFVKQLHPYHDAATSHIQETATPAEVSLVHRLLTYVQDYGLSATKRLMDAVPGEKGDNILLCAQEKKPGKCMPVDGCENSDGSTTVRYGLQDRFAELDIPASKMPSSCGLDTFGRDPAGGHEKSCWIKCAKEKGWVQKAEKCMATKAPFQQWARMPLCAPEGANRNTWPKEETMLQGAIGGFCKQPGARSGFDDLYIDCRYREAYANAVGYADVSKWDGSPAPQHLWIDKAFVTFFKGSHDGMTHSMMVSNLIRSVHFFSKHPIIVFCVGTPKLSLDWDPKVFPRLIVIHAGGIEPISKGRYISFNFNKFRSMLLRVKTGVQVDADMVVGANCDKLFDATEAEVTSQYPYPIMPVHWMSRYREAGKKIDGYDVYAISYPESWPPRIRWAHCHPTWTYHALPFISDALLCKVDHDAWQSNPRVTAALGPAPLKNPPQYMGEDEDLLNILLWRYRALKLWCKWDVDPGVYEDYLNQKSPDPMVDTKWFPNGIPKVFLGIHNTKNTVDTDNLLSKMLRMEREGHTPAGYLEFKGKFYSSPASFQAEHDMKDAPCILV